MSDGFYANYQCQHGVLVLDCYYCSGGNAARLNVSDAQAEIASLRLQLDELRASVPVLETPPPRCPHNRVEMLAHQDDIPPDGPCLVWSPICRDCGDDVPMAAPPVAPTAETLILEQLKKYGAGDVCNTDGTFSDGDADTCNPSDYAAISALHELLLKVRGQ